MKVLEPFPTDWKSLLRGMYEIRPSEEVPWASIVRDRLVEVKVPGMLDKPPFKGRMNSSTGAFEFVQATSADPWDWVEFHVTPWDAATPESEEGAAYSYLHTFARHIFRQLRMALGRQIQTGELSVAGRVGSILEPPTLLVPDVWGNLIIDDWLLGTAIGPAGERVFSIHVGAITAPKSRKVPATSRGKRHPRDLTSELLVDRFTDAELRGLTVKELMNGIESAWREKYGSVRFPRSDTVRRARDELVAETASPARNACVSCGETN